MQATRSTVVNTDSNTKCFDIFACHIGTGIQSNNESKQQLEERYRYNLLAGEYVLLNTGNKATSLVFCQAEIARTIIDEDDKCLPYIRVLRRICHFPETIKFLYVIKEINPETNELENKLITHKFSALKLTPPNEVTIEKIRNHLLSAMERFKNEFLSHTDEDKKLQIKSEIEKEITKLVQEVLSKDDHLTTYGNKTLITEAIRGNFDRIKTYLGSEFDVNFADEDRRTPLFVASYKGHLEIAKFLLSKGAKPDLDNKHGETPLYIASQEGHTKIVELLLNNKVEPNLARSDGATSLFVALENGHLEVVKLLLSAGANPNKARNDGVTPLLMASQEGYKEIVKLLLDKGVDPNLSNKDRITPLLMASQEGYTEIVKLLLDNGANPNLSNEDGTNPLLVASQEGYTEIVKLLLDKGARPDLTDKYSETPLCVVLQDGYPKIATLLLKNGADPNLGNEDGNTPLFLASQEGYIEVVELLLDKGVDPNEANEYGVTPIAVAILQQCTEVVKILLPKVKVNLCIWDDMSVEELIKEKIKDEKEKKELLDVLYLHITPSASPIVGSSKSTLEKDKEYQNVL